MITKTETELVLSAEKVILLQMECNVSNVKHNRLEKKCLKSCQCTENQRCHHVEGCVENQQSTTYQKTTEDHSTSVTLITKMYDGETEKDEGIKEDDNDQINAIFSQKIVVYSMCGAGLLIVITICYVCAKRLKYNRTTNRQNDNNGVNRLPEIPHDLPNPVLVNQERLMQFESLYDEIDEISSDKNNTPVERHDKTSVQSKSESSESESDEKLEYDGYLNPYQQIVKDTDNHDYNTAFADAGKSMEIELKNKQETGYIDAISSNNPNERKYLELLDLQCVHCFNECEVVKDFNALQLNPSQNMQCSGVEDFLISKKHSTSTFQLSSEKNTSKQKPKRQSI
ncbi:unnamed protein product [Mytilus edulis]|uniref:Uncharacterized protein n=1 Tax=Mytilus edulis TaxID=6550 RepID=A0A8S3T8N7_MYTED|nr:unnamed protein product [Mytilus edulis]